MNNQMRLCGVACSVVYHSGAEVRDWCLIGASEAAEPSLSLASDMTPSVDVTC